MKNKSSKIVNVGPLVVKISGNNDIKDQVCRELSQIEPQYSEPIDIEMMIHTKKASESYTPKYYSGDYMNFNESKYFVGDQYYFDYVVEYPFSQKTLKLDIFTKQKSLNFRQKIKALKRVELSNLTSLTRSAILSTSLFWNICQLALLKKECSLIHSATISKNDKAVIFTGTAGAGKTSMLLELLNDPNVNYMSEDFGIVSSSGFAYFNPKTISLYHSDVSFGNPIAEKAIQQLPKKIKKRWNLLTKIFDENQIVKILPKDILGKDRLSESSKVGNVIYMIREQCSEISMENITVDELSERAANAIMREMRYLIEILSLINADCPRTLPYKNSVDMFNMTKNVYLKSFHDLEPKILHMPHKINPKKVCQFLSQKKII